MTRILTTIIMLIVSLAMQAQQGLPINKLFAGDIVPQNEMVETRIKGKEIAKYQLSYFRSLRFEAGKSDVEQIRALLETGKHQDMYFRSDKPSKSLTIMVQFMPQGQLNRFACMKVRNTNKTIENVTVIYMEGRLDSLEKLQGIINNQK